MMTRKQTRDLLRSHRGEGGYARYLRKAIFGGYGYLLAAHFNDQRKAALEGSK